MILFRDWRNTVDFRKHFREVRELSLVDQEKWFESLQSSKHINFMFAIVELETNKVIGAAGLLYIDWVNRSADFSFYIGQENKYIDRVLHHEVFHFIHFDKEDIFDQVVWKQLNDLDFGYKECSTCSNKVSLEYTDKNKGFLTDYSMSTPYEDMAEVYSFMKTNKKILIERSKKDEIIKKKITFLEKQISKLDINFKY